MVAGLGCLGGDSRVERELPAPDCGLAEWRPQATPDSQAAFCVPPGWKNVRASGFWTFSPDSVPAFAGEDRIHIQMWTSRDIVDNSPSGPPSLLRDMGYPCADCFDLAGFAVQWDTVGTRLIRVETARVTGGLSYVANKPALLAAWPVAEGRWLVVQGEAESDSALAQLRGILRTIRTREDGETP